MSMNGTFPQASYGLASFIGLPFSFLRRNRPSKRVGFHDVGLKVRVVSSPFDLTNVTETKVDPVSFSKVWNSLEYQNSRADWLIFAWIFFMILFSF